jgi:hypothetical protein
LLMLWMRKCVVTRLADYDSTIRRSKFVRSLLLHHRDLLPQIPNIIEGVNNPVISWRQ